VSAFLSDFYLVVNEEVPESSNQALQNSGNEGKNVNLSHINANFLILPLSSCKTVYRLCLCVMG